MEPRQFDGNAVPMNRATTVCRRGAGCLVRHRTEPAWKDINLAAAATHVVPEAAEVCVLRCDGQVSRRQEDILQQVLVHTLLSRMTNRVCEHKGRGAAVGHRNRGQVHGFVRSRIANARVVLSKQAESAMCKGELVSKLRWDASARVT